MVNRKRKKRKGRYGQGVKYQSSGTSGTSGTGSDLNTKIDVFPSPFSFFHVSCVR